MTGDTITVLIADDHPVFRDGLKTLLASVTGIEFVGEASTGSEALDMVARTNPDVVVMDLHMPEINGIEATRRLAQTHPHIRVLVLTMFEDDDSVFSALRAGATGYVVKGAGQAVVLRAIEAVGQGEAIFDSSIARKVLNYFSGLGKLVSAQAFPELTSRERELLELIAGGLSNKSIAQRLFLNEKTVRNHVSNIFSKLHVADRAQAIVKAREAGLGRSDPSHS